MLDRVFQSHMAYGMCGCLVIQNSKCQLMQMVEAQVMLRNVTMLNGGDIVLGYINTVAAAGQAKVLSLLSTIYLDRPLDSQL